MGRDKAQAKDSSAGADQQTEQTQPAVHLGAAAKWHAIVREATKFNLAHGQEVIEFHQLTDGKCVGTNAGVSVRLVRQWQMDHKLPADGKVGKATIAAAKRDAKKQKPGEVSFSDEEAGPVEAPQGGDLAAEAVAGGQTGGEEHVPEAEEKFDGDTMASDGIKRVGEDIAEESGKLSGAGKVGLEAASKIALVPHIVSQLRKHDFKGALHTIWDSVGNEEKVEVVKAVIEKIGGELSEHALLWFERAAIAGAAVDVLLIGWEWTKGGLEAIQEAHERGDQKARINCYVYAWSDTIMNGSHDSAGAVTPEEREAAKRGIEDGSATRERQPELPFLLKAEYGNEHLARMALEKSLMEKAGISMGGGK